MRQNGAPPACPRHPGSKVWLDGTYGSGRGRRQRFRCTPADGEPAHRFTESLGAAAPRRFGYTTHEIAAALVEVGRGLSYREAARLVRAQAGRSASTDGNAVADWVEIFAPVLYARYARERWPAVLELDSLAFRARGVGTDDGETTAFQIFAALTPPRRGRAQIVALEVFPRNEQGGAPEYWEEFLSSRAGTPAQIVCDPDPVLARAIAAVWPPDGGGSPTVFLCHRHLARELLELLAAAGVDPHAPYYRTAARALNSAAAWRRFLAAQPPRRMRPLDAWVERHGARITAQLAHGAGVLTSTVALERELALLRERLASRRGNLRNRERTRRLLMLLQLELNGRADPARYEEIIREELLRSDGRAPARRTILDSGGPSLNA